MMKRYFKGIQPHINIEKIEAEIAFLLGSPERAFCGDCCGRVARHYQINRRVHVERRRCIFNYELRTTSKSNS